MLRSLPATRPSDGLLPLKFHSRLKKYHISYFVSLVEYKVPNIFTSNRIQCDIGAYPKSDHANMLASIGVYSVFSGSVDHGKGGLSILSLYSDLINIVYFIYLD